MVARSMPESFEMWTFPERQRLQIRNFIETVDRLTGHQACFLLGDNALQDLVEFAREESFAADSRYKRGSSKVRLFLHRTPSTPSPFRLFFFSYLRHQRRKLHQNGLYR